MQSRVQLSPTFRNRTFTCVPLSSPKSSKQNSISWSHCELEKLYAESPWGWYSIVKNGWVNVWMAPDPSWAGVGNSRYRKSQVLLFALYFWNIDRWIHLTWGKFLGKKECFCSKDKFTWFCKWVLKSRLWGGGFSK